MIDFFSDKADYPLELTQPLREAIEDVCRKYSMKVVYVNIVFVTDQRLLEINRQYLQHDYLTDVITFNYSEHPDTDIEGELYISMERVRENAAVLNVMLNREIARVVLHGVLHLCGFKDEHETDRKKMQIAENELLVSMFHVKHKSNV